MTKLPRYWQPLTLVPNETLPPERPEVIETMTSYYKITETEARAWLADYNSASRVYVNGLYQVQARDEGPFLHLNIRRRDGGMVRDWRHFQQIKNELAGPEREAIELYPAESRLVDTSNKWHLWVLPEGERVNCGWPQRDVQYEENRNVPGLRQRPL